MPISLFTSRSTFIFASILSLNGFQVLATKAPKATSAKAKAAARAKSAQPCELASAKIVEEKISPAILEEMKLRLPVKAHVVVDSWFVPAENDAKPLSYSTFEQMKALGLKVPEGLAVVTNVSEDGYLVFQVEGLTRTIAVLSALPQVMGISKVSPLGTLNKLRAGRGMSDEEKTARFDVERRVTQQFLAQEGAKIEAEVQARERADKLLRLEEVEGLIQDIEDVRADREEQIDLDRHRGYDAGAGGEWGFDLLDEEEDALGGDSRLHHRDDSMYEDLIEERLRLKEELGLL